MARQPDRDGRLVPSGGDSLCGYPAGGEAAGLVPSKTTQFSVSFAPNIVADRRIKDLKRSVWASGHLHGLVENGFRPAVPWFVTLTYAHANAWHSTHQSKATGRFRDWCRTVGIPCRYTWVAEIQPKRLERTGEAVVHYHLLAWLPVGVRMPHWDRPVGRRKAFWDHGMSNTEVARSGIGYLMKYLSKLGEFHRFPKGMRLYGIGGLSEAGRRVRAWYNLPEWVKRTYGVGEVLRKAGRLVVVATAELLEAAYTVSRIPSGIVLTQLRDLPPRFHDGAYSSWPAR